MMTEQLFATPIQQPKTEKAVDNTPFGQFLSGLKKPTTPKKMATPKKPKLSDEEKEEEKRAEKTAGLSRSDFFLISLFFSPNAMNSEKFEDWWFAVSGENMETEKTKAFFEYYIYEIRDGKRREKAMKEKKLSISMSDEGCLLLPFEGSPAKAILQSIATLVWWELSDEKRQQIDAVWCA